MQIKMFSIYDSVAEVYNRPFFLPNKNVALRQFANMCSDPDSQVSLNPTDYTLFELGTWDDSNCKLTKLKQTSLGNGVQFQNTDTQEI